MTDLGGYRLEGPLHIVVPCRSLDEMSRAFGENRQVAFTAVGDLQVSTVFLVLDHSHGHGPPLLFETMIFQGGGRCRAISEWQERCATWAEAEVIHEHGVAYAKGLMAAGETT